MHLSTIPTTRKHTPCTQPHASPTPNTKRPKQVSVVQQSRKQGIALPLYNDEPRIKNPRLRATGLSEHAVTRNHTGSRKHQRLKTAIAIANSEEHAVSLIGTKN